MCAVACQAVVCSSQVPARGAMVRTNSSLQPRICHRLTKPLFIATGHACAQKRNAACSLRWKNWCETEEKCLNTVPWGTRFGSDRSQYSRGETKSQMHGANTCRESCIAISCVMTTASRECAQWACTEDREPELLTRSCRTLHPDVVHLLRNAFSCEAPDAPSRKLESRR